MTPKPTSISGFSCFRQATNSDSAMAKLAITRLQTFCLTFMKSTWQTSRANQQFQNLRLSKKFATRSTISAITGKEIGFARLRRFNGLICGMARPSHAFNFFGGIFEMQSSLTRLSLRSTLATASFASSRWSDVDRMNPPTPPYAQSAIIHGYQKLRVLPGQSIRFAPGISGEFRRRTQRKESEPCLALTWPTPAISFASIRGYPSSRRLVRVDPSP